MRAQKPENEAERFDRLKTQLGHSPQSRFDQLRDMAERTVAKLRKTRQQVETARSQSTSLRNRH